MIDISAALIQNLKLTEDHLQNHTVYIINNLAIRKENKKTKQAIQKQAVKTRIENKQIQNKNICIQQLNRNTNIFSTTTTCIDPIFFYNQIAIGFRSLI